MERITQESAMLWLMITIGVFFISSLDTTLGEDVSNMDYCGISPYHTMCTYPEGPGYRCCGEDQQCVDNMKVGLTQAHKDSILNLQNGFRAKVANGNFYGQQPPAADMLQLVSISPTICKQIFCMKVFFTAFMGLQFGFVVFGIKKLEQKLLIQYT